MKAVVSVEGLNSTLDKAIDYYEVALEDSRKKYAELLEEEVQKYVKHDWFKRSHDYWMKRFVERELCLTHSLELVSGIRRNTKRLNWVIDLKYKLEGVSSITENFILSDDELDLLASVE